MLTECNVRQGQLSCPRQITAADPKLFFCKGQHWWRLALLGTRRESAYSLWVWAAIDEQHEQFLLQPVVS